LLAQLQAESEPQAARAEEGDVMASRRRQKQRQKNRIPSERSRAFDIVADISKNDQVVVACLSRQVRRQYQRSVAKRGGDVEALHFIVSPTLPINAAAQLRARRPAGGLIIDVRELRGPA
jgi:hypothetical protein